MPYIPADRRQALLEGERYDEIGELVYAITEECIEYFNTFAGEHQFATHNAIIGALECAKMEWYRRMAVPYEDKKIVEEGDVYELD
jgi:hypothetical protein